MKNKNNEKRQRNIKSLKSFSKSMIKSNRKLPYHHGLEVNAVLKVKYVSSGTVFP